MVQAARVKAWRKIVGAYLDHLARRKVKQHKAFRGNDSRTDEPQFLGVWWKDAVVWSIP